MAIDIGTLITRMREDGMIDGIAQRTTAQFGTRSQRLIGAELLPERTVERNEYTEESVEYHTVIRSEAITEASLMGSLPNASPISTSVAPCIIGR